MATNSEVNKHIINENVESTANSTFLLLGKTGIGKSTTGNKLLGIYDSDDDKKEYKISECNSNDSIESDVLKFQEGDIGSLDTTTRKCKLLENHTLQIKVLDVTGFSPTFQDSGNSSISVSSVNIKLFINIILAQHLYRLTFSHVIYFLPVRRFPEKGDGILQEEIRLMHYYFGERVFKCMVIVLTASPFDDEDLKISSKLECHTKHVFESAVKACTGIDLCCPPIIFISLKDSGYEVRRKVVSANVHSLQGIKLYLSDDLCIKCNTKSQSVCTDTGVVKSLEKKASEKEKQEKELCHPYFIPTYTDLKKSVGVITNLFSKGYARDYFNLPASFNQEFCIKCKQLRGTQGCSEVSSIYINKNSRIRAEKIKVEHINESKALSAL